MSLTFPEWPPPWHEIRLAAEACVKSGDWGSYDSRSLELLKGRLSELFQVDHVRLCPSGTAGIELALRIAKVSPGDEVIVCGYDYPGNFRSIELLGATPVLVDLAHESLSLNVNQLTEMASAKTRAVIASHLYGNVAEMAPIGHVCRENDWVLIEDACQAPGAQAVQGQTPSPVGRLGDIGVLSFGGSKPLTAGNGGALLTCDPKLKARLDGLCDRPSNAFPLSPLQAAVLVPQLDRLHELNEQRNQRAGALRSFTQQHLTQWELPSFSAATAVSCHYKFAFLAPSSEQRQRIVHTASTWQWPIGEGFRSMHRASPNRCRKHSDLSGCEAYGERLFVLDHRALLFADNDWPQFLEWLKRLHDETASTTERTPR